MKRSFVLVFLATVAFLAGSKTVQWYNTAPPEPHEPSEQAQKLIRSLESGVNWQVGTAMDSLVNEKAGVQVRPTLGFFGRKMMAKVQTYSKYGQPNYPPDVLGFNDNDLWHIVQVLPAAKRHVEEMTAEAVIEKLEKR